MIYKFYGKTKWAKVHTPDEKFKRYTVDAYLDDKSFTLFKKSGIQVEVREDDDGETFVRFGRPVSRVFTNRKTGEDELIKFGPPEVVDADGNPTKELVGNGSECTFEIETFPTVKGIGHRLAKLQVLSLVAYGGGVGMVDAHDLPTEVIVEKPQSAKLAKTAKINRSTVADDEIPF